MLKSSRSYGMKHRHLKPLLDDMEGIDSPDHPQERVLPFVHLGCQELGLYAWAYPLPWEGSLLKLTLVPCMVSNWHFQICSSESVKFASNYRQQEVKGFKKVLSFCIMHLLLSFFPVYNSIHYRCQAQFG